MGLIEKIVSGGQTGVDRGALEATELGFPNGGLVPKGRRAEDGRVPPNDPYARLATLREHPGYKNARSLGAKLYKLAAKYPEADHFRWEPSSAPRPPWCPAPASG